MRTKQNMGFIAPPEDKKLIQEVAKIQRRSVASFLLESAVLRAKKVLEGQGERDGVTA